MEDQLLLPKTVKGGFTKKGTQARQFGKFSGGRQCGGGRWHVQTSTFKDVDAVCESTWYNQASRRGDIC